MHRSTSGTFDDQPFATVTTSGADLTHYQEQLTRERNSRTLNLRRTFSGRPQIPGLGQGSARKGLPMAPPPAIAPANALEAVNSGDAAKIQALLDAVKGVAERGPRLLSQLLHSQEFLDTLSNSLGAGYDNAATVNLMKLIEVVFPFYGELSNQFVDAGVCMYLNDLITSPEMALEAVNLTNVISGRSEYARNAVLCMGIHTTLISTAKDDTPLEVKIACCKCLLTIFTTGGTIESEVLIESAREMYDLLSVDSAEVKSLVLGCYVEMSDEHNEYTTLVFTLYDLGLFPEVVKFLDDPDVTKSALKLIGNMSVAEPAQIREMLNVGLIDKLFELLDTEYAADAFWVMSNLIEQTTNDIIPLITQDFVKQVLEIIESSSCDIQKEATFFLSTLIVFSHKQTVPAFMTGPVIEPLVTMLECGDEKIQLRCMDSLIRMCDCAKKAEADAKAKFVEILNDNDLSGRLDNIIDTGRLVDQAELLQTEFGLLSN